MKAREIVAAAGAVVVALVVMASCGSSSGGAPTGPPIPQYASVCDHGNRLYWLPGIGALGVASQDPSCKQ